MPLFGKSKTGRYEVQAEAEAVAAGRRSNAQQQQQPAAESGSDNEDDTGGVRLIHASRNTGFAEPIMVEEFSERAKTIAGLFGSGERYSEREVADHTSAKPAEESPLAHAEMAHVQMDVDKGKQVDATLDGGTAPNVNENAKPTSGQKSPGYSDSTVEFLKLIEQKLSTDDGERKSEETPTKLTTTTTTASEPHNKDWQQTQIHEVNKQQPNPWQHDTSPKLVETVVKWTFTKMAEEKREFDYIVYGASGFTGQFVLEDVARSLKDSKRTFAVAGRNEAKIKKTLQQSSKIICQELDAVPIVVADSSDAASLAAMAKRCHVVLNCVGPVGHYNLYGEPVVRACVENGTSHVDISGEPIYLERMQKEYNELAEKNKCYVVGACGWDSIPCDIGCDYLRRNFDGDLNAIETIVETMPGPHGYKINKGTYQTLLLGMANAGDLRSIRRVIMPDRVPKLKPALKARGAMFNAPEVGQWCVPFPGSDASVVKRSVYYNYHNNKERPFHIQTYYAAGSLGWALLTALWAALTFFMAKIEFTRKWCHNNVDLASFGAFAENGPTREQAATTRFEYRMFGRGWSRKLGDASAEHDEPTDKSMVVRCDGGDPGYNATSACIVSAAFSIREQPAQLPAKGGVYTPAAALGNTDIVKRLAERGVTFTIEK